MISADFHSLVVNEKKVSPSWEGLSRNESGQVPAPELEELTFLLQGDCGLKIHRGVLV
jgi:hypothetical protein